MANITLHIIMVISGVSLLIASILVTTVFRKELSWSFKGHKILAPAAVGITLVGVIVSGFNFSLAHAWIGFFGFIKMEKDKKKIRKVHVWEGRAWVGMLIVNIVLGIAIIASI
ncbi:hypothetical protein GF325_02845 [Candidatus Bathyarchaeota archaeon]|nr:hypothetical protein [Candidatus Bathyarchaeota archaeon]